MNKSDFLNCRTLVLEVQHLRTLVAELECVKYTAQGLDFSGAPRGSRSKVSPVERRVIRYLDAVDLYREKIAQAEARILAAERAIESLDSPVERLIMRLRYISGRNWTSVYRELRPLGYSDRHVHRLHGCALMKLKEI